MRLTPHRRAKPAYIEFGDTVNFVSVNPGVALGIGHDIR